MTAAASELVNLNCCSAADEDFEPCNTINVADPGLDSLNPEDDSCVPILRFFRGGGELLDDGDPGPSCCERVRLGALREVEAGSDLNWNWRASIE